MISILVYIVTGILLIMVPHFILPVDLIEGGRNGWILSECSFWYHPESFIGMVLVGTGIICFMSHKAKWLAGVLSVLLLIQGVALKPLSFYLQSTDNLVILGHTISLNSHAYLRTTIIVLGLLTLLAFFRDLYLARRQVQNRPISLLGLSISNIRRKSFRSVALVLALAVVIGAFFSNLLLTKSIGNALTLGAGRLGADLVVVPKGREDDARDILKNGTPHIFNMPIAVYDELAQMPEIEQASPQIFFRPFSYLVCCTTEQVLVVGYDPDTDFTIKPWINYHLKKDQKDNEIVVGSQVKFYPGQSIALLGRRIKVAASLDNTGIGYFDSSAFIPISGAIKLINFLKKNESKGKLHNRKGTEDLSLAHLFDPKSIQKEQLAHVDSSGISTIFVKVNYGVDVKAFAKKIEKEFPEVAVVNVKAATASIKRQLTSMLDAFALPIFILVGMGTIILTVVFSMSANERQREVGLLRAMGAKKSHIFQLFLAEFMTITMLGGLFGVLGGGSMLILFKNNIMAALNLLYIWPDLSTVLQVFSMTFIVALLIGVGAGLYPSLRAAKLEPYQAVRGS